MTTDDHSRYLPVCGAVGTLTTASGVIHCFCCAARDHIGNHNLILSSFYEPGKTAQVNWGDSPLECAPLQDFPKKRCAEWFHANRRGIAWTPKGQDYGLASFRVPLWCELSHGHPGPHQRSHQVEGDKPMVVRWD